MSSPNKRTKNRGQAKERFDEEGISIPFPQRDVHLIQDSSASNGKANSENGDVPNAAS